MWFYASLLEQREFIMVLIVHACVFFVFFFLVSFSFSQSHFLVCVSSFRFFYSAEQTNPLIPCLFTLTIFFFVCGLSARCRAISLLCRCFETVEFSRGEDVSPTPNT
jgi:hypothetical protein